jgi:hypothetical protein
MHRKGFSRCLEGREIRQPSWIQGPWSLELQGKVAFLRTNDLPYGFGNVFLCSKCFAAPKGDSELNGSDHHRIVNSNFEPQQPAYPYVVFLYLQIEV